MPKTLKYDDIVDILYGAAFLGGGGGGPLNIALDMLKGYENRTVCLYDWTEMKDTDCAVVVAAMGNPMKAAGKDFNSILNNTFHNIKNISSQINCVLPGECGGFNTFAPIYLALNNPTIKLIDADASGRAVPGLDTSLASVNGVPITPFAVTSEHNDWITINTSSDKNMTSPEKCEMIARQISGTKLFGDVGGIAGWIMDCERLINTTVLGSISKCQKIGIAIREYKEESAEVRENGIFVYLHKKVNLICETLEDEAKLLYLDENDIEGFVDGGFQLSLSNKVRRINIRYLNEFLVCSKIWVANKWKDADIWATAPTIIVIFDEENFVPVTDSYLKENAKQLTKTRLSLGIVSVKDTWGKIPLSKLDEVWKKYFNMVGYDGSCKIY